MEKDPERVRLGRLGAWTLHAAGKTNTAPARAAWEAKLTAEIDPDGTLSEEERRRRARYALRAKMTRLAMLRWAKKDTASRQRDGAPEDRVHASTPSAERS